MISKFIFRIDFTYVQLFIYFYAFIFIIFMLFTLEGYKGIEPILDEGEDRRIQLLLMNLIQIPNKIDQAIDLSLTSNQEKNTFFYTLKSLYQIKGLNLKCYKIDERLNLNNNKMNLEEKIEQYSKISHYFYHPETGEKIDYETICYDEIIVIKTTDFFNQIFKINSSIKQLEIIKII